MWLWDMWLCSLGFNGAYLITCRLMEAVSGRTRPSTNWFVIMSAATNVVRLPHCPEFVLIWWIQLMCPQDFQDFSYILDARLGWYHPLCWTFWMWSCKALLKLYMLKQLLKNWPWMLKKPKTICYRQKSSRLTSQTKPGALILPSLLMTRSCSQPYINVESTSQKETDVLLSFSKIWQPIYYY